VANRLLRVVAIVVAVVGAVFTLQGIGVLRGSFMSGSATWAIIGVAMVVIGVVAYARVTRTR
jgi:hypothetical protein